MCVRTIPVQERPIASVDGTWDAVLEGFSNQLVTEDKQWVVEVVHSAPQGKYGGKVHLPAH